MFRDGRWNCFFFNRSRIPVCRRQVNLAAGQANTTRRAWQRKLARATLCLCQTIAVSIPELLKFCVKLYNFWPMPYEIHFNLVIVQFFQVTWTGLKLNRTRKNSSYAKRKLPQCTLQTPDKQTADADSKHVSVCPSKAACIHRVLHRFTLLAHTRSLCGKAFRARTHSFENKHPVKRSSAVVAKRMDGLLVRS